MGDQSAVFPATWADKPNPALSSGISSGSGGISSGVGDPVAAPSNPAIDNIYFDTSTTPYNEWVWPAGGSAWAQS